MALFGAVWPDLRATVGKRWILVSLVLPLLFGAFPVVTLSADPLPMTGHAILINGAPVLTLWAATVAERLGFDR